MADRFDVVILGMGPGGEVAAGKLIASGKKVAVVERELIGGECAYWACIPSKILLRPPEVRAEATRAFGTGTPTLELKDVFDYRDQMIRNLDDSGQVESYEGKGATVVKGAGRLAGPGRVEVDGRTLEAEHVIVATGSMANVLPIEGLDEVLYWTNREATTTSEVPERAVIVGGGPNGIETGQWLSRLGSAVTIIEQSDGLIDREDPRVGETIREILEDESIGIRTDRRVEKARKEDGDTVVMLDDGEEIGCDVVVLTAGRTSRVEEIGLESVGVEPQKAGLSVDDRCRVEGGPEGLWAVGDVTGVLLFTHVAQYQGRIVADNILGGDRTALYRGIPRVIFSDPEVAATGLTEEEARQNGIDVAAVDVDLTKVAARPWTYEENPRGRMGLVVDRGRGVLVGAWIISPQAGEWIHYVATAVREETPIERLLDTVPQFPTFSGAFIEGLEMLDL
jgi:dihydrolipoamide dehydrogenase